MSGCNTYCMLYCVWGGVVVFLGGGFSIKSMWCCKLCLSRGPGAGSLSWTGPSLPVCLNGVYVYVYVCVRVYSNMFVLSRLCCSSVGYCWETEMSLTVVISL